eukprot:scaffold399508_cov110-Attheya_sp.AAC.1
MGTQPPGSGLRRALRRLRRTGTNCTCLLTTATPLIVYPSSVRLSSFPTRTGVPGTYRNKGAEAQELRKRALLPFIREGQIGQMDGRWIE